jgi:hypothetical protein
MASEAEIERLYQLFVANGGGNLTFSGTNLTPKQYSDAVSASNLTPLEMAQLEARQHQYNRQAALNSIANEIEANNFTNPYATRGAYGNSLFSALGSSSGATQVGLIGTALSGFSDTDKALIFAGVLSQTGIDLEKILKIVGLSALGIAMYTSLTNHTNNQTANIPGTMQDASSLASMNEQFGEQGSDPCSGFNQLMGILAGIYDGTLDFIDNVIGDITTLLNDTGIISLLTGIYNAIVAAGSVVADVITAIVGVGIAVLGGLVGLVVGVINAIGDITLAIANEIAALADMAAQLLAKALALVLGGAALDPCKKKVLENTGTTEMKEAVKQINQPLGTGNPHIVGTTIDNRANAEEVKREMKYSRDEAKLNPGVPQSYATDEAKNYIPKDSDSDSSIHTKIYNSSYTINGQGVTVTEYKDYKAFSKGEMTADEEVAYRARFSESDLYKNEKNSLKLPITSSVYTEAKSKWIPLQKAYIQSQGTLLSEIWLKYVCGIFAGKETLKPRLEELHSELGRNTRVVKKLLIRNFNKNFRYHTENGKIDKAMEDKVKNSWVTISEPAIQRKYDLAIKNLNETRIAWESISSQVNNKPNCTGSASGVTSDLSDLT